MRFKAPLGTGDSVRSEAFALSLKLPLAHCCPENSPQAFSWGEGFGEFCRVLAQAPLIEASRRWKDCRWPSGLKLLVI